MLDHEHPITTVESALAYADNVLQRVSDNSRLDARLLLCEVMGVTRDYLIRYPDRALTVEQANQFNNLVLQRSHGTPIAYLLERQPFYDIEVFVTSDVLIPRPETELLVEKAIEWAQSRPHCFIVDVGTGSGVIALTLAKHLPHAHVTGIDISDAALEIVQRNALHLGLQTRIRWLKGDLLQPVLKLGEQVDLIVANPPYIPTADLEHLEVAKHEPRIALDGGVDGLQSIRRLLRDVPAALKPEGMVFMEIGYDQGNAMRQLVAQEFPALRILAIEPDLAGHDRVVKLGYAE